MSNTNINIRPISDYNIYWEQQRGDLCRLHSLNAYFKEEKIKLQEFYDYCKEYDKIVKGLDTSSMDGFYMGRNIVSHIMSEIGNQFCLYIPINSYSSSRSHIDIERYKSFLKSGEIKEYFEFNKKHIWFNRLIDKENNLTVKIDSLSGLTRIDPNIGKNGYFLIISDFLLNKEVSYYINKLQTNIGFKEMVKKETIKEIDIFDYEVILFNLYFSTRVLRCNGPRYNVFTKLISNFYKIYTKEEKNGDDYAHLKRCLEIIKDIIDPLGNKNI